MIELRPAGITSRFYAFLLDWLIRIVIIYAFAMAASAMSGIGTAMMFILLFGLEWLLLAILRAVLPRRRLTA